MCPKYLCFIISVLILKLNLLHSLKVTTLEEEVDEIVIQSVKDTFDGLPKLTVAYLDLSSDYKDIFNTLLAKYGICVLFSTYLLRYCHLILQDKEEFDMAKYDWNAHCQNMPIHLNLQHTTNLFKYLYECPKIKTNDGKRDFISGIDGKLSQIIHYMNRQGKDEIKPHQVFRDITVEDLFNKKSEGKKRPEEETSEPKKLELKNTDNVESTHAEDKDSTGNVESTHTVGKDPKNTS